MSMSVVSKPVDEKTDGNLHQASVRRKSNQQEFI